MSWSRSRLTCRGSLIWRLVRWSSSCDLWSPSRWNYCLSSLLQRERCLWLLRSAEESYKGLQAKSWRSLATVWHLGGWADISSSAPLLQFPSFWSSSFLSWGYVNVTQCQIGRAIWVSYFCPYFDEYWRPSCKEIKFRLSCWSLGWSVI